MKPIFSTTRSISATAFLLAVVFAATPLFAQERPSRGPETLAPGLLGRCLTVLELTDAQKEGIRSAVAAAKPALRAAHEQLRAARQEFKTAIEASSPEACSVGASFLKMRAAEQAVNAEMAALRTKIEALLTSDQRLKFTGCVEGSDRPDRP